MTISWVTVLTFGVTSMAIAIVRFSFALRRAKADVLFWEAVSANYRAELVGLRLEVEELKFSRDWALKASSAMMVDPKTEALVRLAVTNTEEHEQRNAAMLVCKRLMAKLK